MVCLMVLSLMDIFAARSSVLWYLRTTSLIPRLMKERAILSSASSSTVSSLFTTTLRLWNTLIRVAILTIFLTYFAKLGMTSKTICTRFDVDIRGWEWTMASEIFKNQGSFPYTLNMRAISSQSKSLHMSTAVGALYLPVGYHKEDWRKVSDISGSSQSKIKEQE